MAIDFENTYATGTFNLVTGAVNIQYLIGKENDTGAGIFIEMRDANNALVPPSVETMILYATRPDGTRVYFVAEYDNDKMRIDFNNSLYEVSGNVTAEIQLIDANGLTKKSNTFTINAIESVFDASYVRSTDDFRVIYEALEDVKFVQAELQNITPEQVTEVSVKEQERQASEAIRVSQEGTRVSQENTRKSQETGRVNAEILRVSNEDERIINEDERISNEIQRINTINDLQLAMGVSIATLGVDGKLAPNQIPSISVTDTFSVTSTAQMTGLTAQKGDIALMFDGDEHVATYILAGDSTVLADWKKMGTGYVAEAGHAETASIAENATRINGYTVVTLTQAEYDSIVKDDNTIYLVVG